MQEQQQYILEDEPMKVMSLFPKRQVTEFNLNLDIYSQLFENLTCSICQQILNNPAYLRCSHRFCKECIEKYIRSNTKKSCPNCRSGITTKRDLRIDESLQFFISSTFGDIKKLSKNLDEIDQMELTRHKSMEVMRVDQLLESKQRSKPETTDDIYVPTAGSKKVKGNDGEDLKGKKKDKSQKKIESKGKIQKESSQTSLPSKKVKNEDKQVKKFEGFRVQLVTREFKKKKNIEIIQIESGQEVYEQKNPKVIDLGEQCSLKNVCSINVIPQISEISSSRMLQSFQEKDFEKIVQQNASKLQIQLSNNQSKDNLQQARKKEIQKQVQRAKGLLKQQFGDNFLNKIIELTKFSIFLNISLKKHPLSPFTPAIQGHCFKFLAKSSLSSVFSFLAQEFNINKTALRLFTSDGIPGSPMIQVQSGHKLLQLNDKYWKLQCQFELIQVEEFLQKMALETKSKNPKPKEPIRVIYYMVDYSKIIL